MAIHKASGFITNIKNFLEDDKIVTILTKDSGRLEFKVKAGRNILSKKAASLELLNEIKFTYADASIDLITEIELQDSLISKIDNKYASLIFYFAEIINKIYLETNLSTYNELNLNRAYLAFYPFHATLKLQLNTLNELGSFNDIYSCIICGNDLKEERYFSPIRQGFICKTHNEGRKVEDKVIKTLNYFAENDLEQIIKINIERDFFIILFDILNDWIEKASDSNIKSAKLLMI